MKPQPVDERILVCEGKCNPDIRMFDEQVVSLGGGRSDKSYVKQLARGLRHTMHVRVTDGRWSGTFGWYRQFKCTECGHIRNF